MKPIPLILIAVHSYSVSLSACYIAMRSALRVDSLTAPKFSFASTVAIVPTLAAIIVGLITNMKPLGFQILAALIVISILAFLYHIWVGMGAVI